ncbi:tetratricopeptide repeat protein [candidate division KSB1 bacterium]|nr:tetratricopeptide repeat protein [candidate division KSB1 bacterium]
MLIDGFEQHEAQGWNINLEYARFCLGNQIDLTAAHDRMESEYRRRPHNVDVLETYAWALYKNNRFNDSQEIILKALRLNPHDARMNYKAAKIAEKLGQQEKAKTHFVKAGTLFLFNISS